MAPFIRPVEVALQVYACKGVLWKRLNILSPKCMTPSATALLRSQTMATADEIHHLALAIDTHKHHDFRSANPWGWSRCQRQAVSMMLSSVV